MMLAIRVSVVHDFLAALVITVVGHFLLGSYRLNLIRRTWTSKWSLVCDPFRINRIASSLPGVRCDAATPGYYL